MSQGHKPSSVFGHQSVPWNGTIPTTNVNYAHQKQESLERKSVEEKVFSSDMRRHNDNTVNAPLQNCPNIVDHVAFSKSNSSRR